MNRQVLPKIKHHDDTAQTAASPSDYGLLKAMMDWNMNWPRYNPDQDVLGSMRGEILEWLNSNPALRGDNRFGFDQARTGELSFTHYSWSSTSARMPCCSNSLGAGSHEPSTYTLGGRGLESCAV